jgi:hypothetical protein
VRREDLLLSAPHAEGPASKQSCSRVPVRATLALAGLFQLTHEMLKSIVLDDVKSFYGYISVGDGTWLPECGEHEYRRKVLDLVPGKPFRASLLWLQNMDTITPEQAARLEDIYAHRHDLIHELARYLIDPDLEPDFDLFIEALKTLRGISRFWTEVGLATAPSMTSPTLTSTRSSTPRRTPRPLHTRVRRGPDRVTGNGPHVAMLRGNSVRELPMLAI